MQTDEKNILQHQLFPNDVFPSLQFPKISEDRWRWRRNPTAENPWRCQWRWNFVTEKCWERDKFECLPRFLKYSKTKFSKFKSAPFCFCLFVCLGFFFLEVWMIAEIFSGIIAPFFCFSILETKNFGKNNFGKSFFSFNFQNIFIWAYMDILVNSTHRTYIRNNLNFHP